MMSHSSGTFFARDGYQLFEQQWVVADPKAAVILVHGYAEHSGRYAHVAHALNEAGYAVYAYDHVGHGRSEGESVYVESFDTYASDLAQFVTRVRLEAGNRPIYLLAHSMGGRLRPIHALHICSKLTAFCCRVH